MTELALAAQFAEAVYQLQPQHIELLPPLLEQRGIFRIHDTRGRTWLLRLLQQPRAAAAFAQTARLLDWLEQQGYPAARLCRTEAQHLVGRMQGWASILLSYIEGDVLEVHSPHFEQLGQTLAQLHVLSTAGSPALPQSRCHPKLLHTHTLRQLAEGQQRAPVAFQPLVAALQASVRRLAAYHDELCLTHGDCWYKNAIHTPSGRVILIDWDCAGIGWPLLDLGYLLLTAHYDLRVPLQIAADEQKIQAILRGYQRIRPISGADATTFIGAIQFALAFHLGEYLVTQPDLQADDIVLKKIQARFDATPEIARLAIASMARVG